VISTDSWVVNATVDSTSVDLIKAGDQAQLTVSGATDSVYGTISTVSVLSSSSSGTASYPVVVAVTGSPKGLHDGASVTATLIYKQLANVIVIPTTALHRNTDGTEYVEKVVKGKAVQTTVETGTTSGAQVEITKGLAAGDVVQETTFRRTTTGTSSNGTTGRTGTGGGFGGGNFTPPAGGFGGVGGGTGGGFGG
jgi:multidrug efflux pump subunit AcrA (membrane-fusion protein)